MSDETLRILKLLEAGRITSQEAEALLAAIKEPAVSPADEDDDHRHHDFDPVRMVARVMDEVNPGQMAAEAVERARERMERHHRLHIRASKLPKLPRMPDIPRIMECCFGSHQAEEEQVITVPAEGIRTLALSQPRSQIKVSGSDTDQIVIKADVQVWGDDEEEAQERLKSLKVATENESGTLRIKLEGPPWTKKRRARVDFDIEAPKHLFLELGTASGEIEVSSIQGGAKLNSASGEISLEGCSGKFEVSTASGDIGIIDCDGLSARVQTASGDIEAKGCSGDLTLQSVSGDLSLDLSSAELQISTISGDLELAVETLRGLSASTTSGDISIEIRTPPEGDIRLASVSGDVELEIPDGSDISLEAATASGDIDCGLALEDRSQTSRRLTGKLGNGRLSVSIKTTSGDIDISS